MGESARDEFFLNIMRDALRDVLDVRSMGIFEPCVVDPTFAAARGATDFDKRMMKSPNDYIKSLVCK